MQISRAKFLIPNQVGQTAIKNLKNLLEVRSAGDVIGIALELLTVRLDSEPAMFASQLSQFQEEIDITANKSFDVKICDAARDFLSEVMDAMDTEVEDEAVAFALWHANLSIGKDPLVCRAEDGSWYIKEPMVELKPNVPDKKKPAVFQVIKGGLDQN